MRKFLMVAAVGALALLMAVPASAVDFKFSGEWRVRFYDGVNIGFNKDVAPTGSGSQFLNTQAGPNARGAQIRIRPRFDASDDNQNIQAVWRIEVGDVEFGNGGGAFNNTNFGNPIGSSTARIGNGAGGGGGSDGINVETKWAYLDFAMPFGVPARVRAGIQPWYLPKGIVVDDDAAGLMFYGKQGMVSWNAAWFRPSSGMQTNPGLASGNVICNNVGGVAGAVGTVATAAACRAGGGVPTFLQNPVAPAQLNTVDNNYDVYQIKVDLAINEMFNPGMYFLYGDNRINCSGTDITIAGGTQCAAGLNRTRPSYYFGLTTTGKIGPGNYDFDFVYGAAEGGPSGAFGGNTAVNGWALDVHYGFPIGPVTVNLAGSYSTGDKRDGDKSEAFPGGIAPSWNGPGGGFEMLGSGGPFDAVEFTQDTMTNLWAIGFWLEYRPVKALWLKAAYAYAGFATSTGNCGVVGGACYGPAYTGKNNALAGKSKLGQEISFRADYDVWTNFKIQGQMGWFIPSGGDTAAEYVLQLLYNF